MQKVKRRRKAWTMILVPPNPHRRTRQISVSTRRLAAVGATALVLLVAGIGWTEQTSTIAAATADRLAESQRTILSLVDSVQTLHVLAVRASHMPPRDMIMPVSGEITSRFSLSRFHPILDIFRAHRGVDLAAPIGTKIVAPAAGRVRSVGWRFAYGLTVELEHSGDVVTRYAHCRKALVHAGDQVTIGQPIATVGESGLTTGPHVHFEVLVHGKQVDPVHFLATTRTPDSTARQAEPSTDQRSAGMSQ